MRKKISPPKRINSEIEKYPMVSVEWFDIVSDSSWTSFDALKKSNLATCITKGHLLSQTKGKTLSKRCLKLYRPVSVFTDPRSLKPRSSFSFPYHWPTVQQQLVKELVQPEAEEQELVLVSRPC
jgi:hypothetical protein